MFTVIRQSAEAFNEQGDVCYQQKNFSKAFEFYQAAINKLAEIKLDDFIEDDYRRLAVYQNNAGITCDDIQQEFAYFKAAQHTMGMLLAKTSVMDDHRQMAKYQHNAGIACKDKKEAYLWFEQASERLMQVPADSRTYTDNRQLYKYQHNAGILCADPMQMLIWFEQANANLARVAFLDRTIDDWLKRAKCFENAAIACKNMDNLSKAQSCLHLAIDAYYQAIIKKYNLEYDKIIPVYQGLEECVLPGTMEQEFYAFAQQVFNCEKNIKFNDQISKIYLHITKSPPSQSNILLSGTLQLLQLIEETVNQSNFPNETVKKSLKNEMSAYQYLTLFNLSPEHLKQHPEVSKQHEYKYI